MFIGRPSLRTWPCGPVQSGLGGPSCLTHSGSFYQAPSAVPSVLTPPVLIAWLAPWHLSGHTLNSCLFLQEASWAALLSPNGLAMCTGPSGLRSLIAIIVKCVFGCKAGPLLSSLAWEVKAFDLEVKAQTHLPFTGQSQRHWAEPKDSDLTESQSWTGCPKTGERPLARMAERAGRALDFGFWPTESY